MITYPNIDPIIVSFGALKITWYSLSYVLGILFGWYYCCFLVKKLNLNINNKQIEDFIAWIILSIIIGGRLGYVLFYDLDYYLEYPTEILKTYQGGMSFHGAIIGVLIASISYASKNNIKLNIITDLICTAAPFGIMLGRIANFINGELYGKVSDIWCAMIFPSSPEFSRHPSQLYEAFSEGLLSFAIINFVAFKYNTFNKPFFQTGLFLLCYGTFRSICEIFREPDGVFWIFSQGQMLSVPMIIIGLIIILYKQKIKII